VAIAFPVLAGGCCEDRGDDPSNVRASTASAPRRAPASPSADGGLVDVASAAGIDFVHENGASGARYMPETTAGGVAWLDFDGDGRLDLYAVNGNEHPDDGRRGSARNRLWRNRGDGSFEDVTGAAGVGDTGYGVGVAVGDYDNDGRPDIYVTNFGANVLYHNEGGGRFRDVTETAGAGGSAWSASATFVDVDADGLLDLWVCNYVRYDATKSCRTQGRAAYCSPKEFAGEPDCLYRNLGGGRFEEIGERAGIAIGGMDAGKSLGVVALDYDDDGDQDVYVACDQVPNLLFQNDGTGRFDEVGLLADVAYSSEGAAQAGMGVDAGDIDLDGRIDIVVTNFSDERSAHYRNEGGGFFQEVGLASGFGGATLPTLGFGIVLFDRDLDGDLDVYIGNGHVLDNAAELRPGQSFAQPDQLLENQDGVRFRDVSAGSGACFARATVSRGVAAADFDEDGDDDLAVISAAGPLALLRNDAPRAHWIALRLEGRESSRDAYGARVVLTARRDSSGGARGADDRSEDFVRVAECRSGRSFASACDPRVRFGLGSGEVRVVEVDIRWPSGRRQSLADLEIDRTHVVVEADGEPGAPPAIVAAVAARASTMATSSSIAVGAAAGTAPRRVADAESLRREAEVLANRHRVQEALQLIDDAAGRALPAGDWSDAEAALRERQARLLTRLSRPGEARMLLDALVARRPESASARLALAKVRLDLGDAAGALAELDALPRDARLAELATLGRALGESGDAAAGIAAFAAALVLDPWCDECWLALGRAIARTGREDLAKPLLEGYRAGEGYRVAEQEAVAFEFGGDQARGLHRRGVAEEARGRLHTAMGHFRAAIDANRGFGPAYLGLAGLSIFLCQPDDAVRVLETVRAQGVSDASLLEMLGRAQEADGDANAAMRAYAEALERDPERERARARLASLRAGGTLEALPTSEPAAVRAVRESVRDRVRDRSISLTVDELALLVAAQLENERAEDGRRLALFLAEIAPRRDDNHADIHALAVRAFSRPSDLFVRLWLARRAGALTSSALDAELTRLGVDVARVVGFLGVLAR